MKITDLKTLVVNAVMRNWVFVKVETDQPGVIVGRMTIHSGDVAIDHCALRNGDLTVLRQLASEVSGLHFGLHSLYHFTFITNTL